ncbi:MAG: 50S ribosomal protein L11 [Candidatus Aenigmatarchaeota archaeon]
MTTIKAVVQAGKASAGPPLGPSLATAKLNTNEVITAINEKTKDMEGLQVPVTIEVNSPTDYKISVGTPSITALVRKELKVKKLAKAPFNVYEKEEVKEEFKESLTFDQVVKVAKVKMESMKTDDLKNAVKQTVAFCVSAGVYVEDKKPKDILVEIDEGKWDEKIV